jgi:pilus assembly protein Flp/PilA
MRDNIPDTKVKPKDLNTHIFTHWFTDESGVTAIEYGLLAALIAVTIVGAVSATGTSLGALYTTWSTAVLAAL